MRFDSSSHRGIMEEDAPEDDEEAVAFIAPRRSLLVTPSHSWLAGAILTVGALVDNLRGMAAAWSLKFVKYSTIAPLNYEKLYIFFTS